MRHDTIIRSLAAAAAVAFLLSAGIAGASEQIAETENLVCTACHDKPGSKLLTDRGKYFELMGSLDGFTEVKASFSRCTYCHARKPGKKLTKSGKGFATLVGDMDGLLHWMRSEHPKSAPEASGEETAASAPRPMPAH